MRTQQLTGGWLTFVVDVLPRAWVGGQLMGLQTSTLDGKERYRMDPVNVTFYRLDGSVLRVESRRLVAHDLRVGEKPPSH